MRRHTVTPVDGFYECERDSSPRRQKAQAYESSDEEGPEPGVDAYVRFGKYKGQKVSALCKAKESRRYLRWARDTVDKLDPITKRAIEHHLDLYEQNKIASLPRPVLKRS